LAQRLSASLDERQCQAANGAPLPLSVVPAGNRPTAYRRRWLQWERDGHILPRDRPGWYHDMAWRNLTRLLAARLRPAALAYVGPSAVAGFCRLLILPQRNLTAAEYPSGIWHHDRCGKRLKCYLFLDDVTPSAHPMLLVPRTHLTVYYSYSLFDASRFSDEHVEQHHAAPRMMLGGRGEGFCFDTNGIHRGSLPGTRARYTAVVEFHDEQLELTFKAAGVPRAPFGE